MHDALLALADHDAEVVHLRHEVDHPGSAGALQAADAELAELRAAKRELDVQLAPLAGRAKDLERDAAAARQRASTIAARLSEATGAGRDLEAMSHEADALTSRANVLDDELYGILEALEPLEAHDASLRARFLDARSRSEAAVVAIEGERERARSALVELEAARPALAAQLDASLLSRYEAAAAHAGGGGAARLVDGRCGRCRVAVPSSVEDRVVRGWDPDVVVVCDECGRLLVR